MKIIFTLIVLFIACSSFAQDLGIKNNLYDKANDLVKKRKSFNRERHFYEQRMYPYNFIPKDAYEKAYKQKEELTSRNGYEMMSTFDTWSNIGPTTGFYFSYSNITSRMTTVQYDPNNGNTIYIGAAFGGVWKSTDAGLTWTPKSDNEVSMSSGSIAIDPVNSNIIYYGTGEATYSGASYYGRGLLKSTNGGNNWTNYSADLPNLSYCSRIVIRPNNSNHLLAAMGNSGLYRSTNAGINWALLVSGRCDDVVFSPTGDTAYITGIGTGYRISVNGGASFTSSAALTMGDRNHLAICNSSPNILYCSIYASSSISVFKSTNSGSTFFQVASGQNFSGSQAWYDFYIHVNPKDPNYAYVGSIDVWRTTNGGTNFANVTNAYNSGNVHPDQHNAAFHPTDINQMVCVNDGGIWKSTNRGANWTNINTNLTLTQFYRIASDPSNSGHILGGTQDNGTQRTTGPINWTAAFGGDGGEVCFHIKNNSYVLGETQNNGVYRSTNGGSGWSSSTSGLSGSASWVSPIISHPDSNTIFYTARQQVFKTTNWGATWFAISDGTSGTIREMAISKSSPNVMLAASGSSIYKSTNRGYNFSNAGSGLPSRTITSVNIHPDSPQVAVITFSGFGAGKIYKTTNGGSSWNNISGNLPDAPANDAYIFYPGMSTSTYYIATDVGVFVTNNYGQTWLELANGLPNTVAMHLDYHQTSNKLRVGTHGRGTWEIQVSAFALDVQALNTGASGTQVFNSVSVYPTGTVRNNAAAVSTFNVNRKINPGSYSSTKTISNLSGAETAEVTFDLWTFTPGITYSVKDSVYLSGDLNSVNDTLSGFISPFIGETIVKLCEGFYSVVFPPLNWTIQNNGSTGRWSRNEVSSYGIGTGSAKYDFWNATAGTNQSLVTPTFVSTVSGDSLQFDNSYSPYTDPSYTDSLIIESSTNAGTNYSTLVRLWGNITNGNLNTTGASGSEFTPLPNQWTTRKYALPAGTNKIRFRARSGFGNNLFLDSIKIAVNILHTEFKIKIIPEGFYNLSNGKLNMKDTVKILLRNSLSPYNIADSAISIIDSVSFTGSFIFTKAVTGNYFIVVMHRNTIETWSKNGGELLTQGLSLNFDFSNQATQAYGNNLVLKGTKYCIYSGDVDRDNNIDISDLGLIDNDIYLFSQGFLNTDLTGDQSADLSDAAIADNNASNFISLIRP